MVPGRTIPKFKGLPSTFGWFEAFAAWRQVATATICISSQVQLGMNPQCGGSKESLPCLPIPSGVVGNIPDKSIPRSTSGISRGSGLLRAALVSLGDSSVSSSLLELDRGSYAIPANTVPTLS